MGELLPCPFCGFRMIASDALRTRNRTVYVHEAHEGECPAMNVIIHSDNQARITAWNTRPRTEGRGEGKHADQVQDVVAALYKAWPDAEDIPSDWPLGIIGCIEQIIAERDAALAPPIREPEISRDLARIAEALDAAQKYFDGYCKDEAADDGEDFTGCSHEQHVAAKRLGDALSEISLDAILNLAPVGGWEEGSARADLSPASRSPDQHSAGGEG